MTNHTRMFYRHIILQFNKFPLIEKSIAFSHTANKVTGSVLIVACLLCLVSLHNRPRSRHEIACAWFRFDNCVTPLLAFLGHRSCHHELEALRICNCDIVLFRARDLDLLRGCEWILRWCWLLLLLRRLFRVDWNPMQTESRRRLITRFSHLNCRTLRTEKVSLFITLLMKEIASF